MSLSIDDIYRSAQLARIGLTEDEALALQQQLNPIFDLIEVMQEVDTTGVEPMSHAQDVVLRLRDDVCTASGHHAQWQAIAPSFEKGLYWVPEIIASDTSPSKDL